MTVPISKRTRIFNQRLTPLEVLKGTVYDFPESDLPDRGRSLVTMCKRFSEVDKVRVGINIQYDILYLHIPDSTPELEASIGVFCDWLEDENYTYIVTSRIPLGANSATIRICGFGVPKSLKILYPKGRKCLYRNDL